ncbi:hypothetical protein STEG23_030386, partial [Scotinomys teguina]
MDLIPSRSENDICCLLYSVISQPFSLRLEIGVQEWRQRKRAPLFAMISLSLVSHTTEEWIRKMWFIYTMEYYAAEKNNDIMKFTGKLMELENVILSKDKKKTHLEEVIRPWTSRILQQKGRTYWYQHILQ